MKVDVFSLVESKPYVQTPIQIPASAKSFTYFRLNIGSGFDD